MSDTTNLLIFHLDSVRYAISLSGVERVTHAVEVTHLPSLTGNISGIINIHGLIVPVINTRRMMGLPERKMTPDDIFIIAHTTWRTVALIADTVEQAVLMPEDRITTTDRLLPEFNSLTGIARLENGIILIHDLEACISAEEARIIDSVLDKEL